MGQTLTHGVYLPDEGERNCYDGLAANWQLLDGAVGTIAAHTAALAGKAPAVHTHTKADITDFPAYGTTAGTICEGNDSRLSDARTPIAHTHTKSDVTDLLNSNFIPSANNSYDLGSSSYQWSSVYAQTYYYNGTEFSNKFVTIDTSQTISGLKYFSSNILHKTPLTIDVSTNPAEVITGKGLQFVDNAQYWGDITPQWTTDGTFRIRIAMTNYNTLGTSTGWFCPIVLDLAKDGSKIDIWSTHPNSALGTSTHKWKSLNGINPGALSLPATTYSDIDTTNWVLTGAAFNYIPVLDGWVEINLNAKTNDFNRISVENVYYRHSTESAAGRNVMLTFPVRANQSYELRLWGASIAQARFIKCEGNV